MTAAVPRASLIVFQSARNVLKQCSGKLVREHPLAALLGLLVNRDNIPLVGSNRTPVGSDQLSGLLNQVYNKSAPFDEEMGPSAVMRRAGFGDMALPSGNEWRNAFGSQKGLGCFARDYELQSISFRHADRNDCIHRTQGVNGDRCDLSPGQNPNSYTVCKSVDEHAGEVPKLLQIISGGGNSYGYRMVMPDGGDLKKLLSTQKGDRVPLWPFLVAFYAGSSCRFANGVVTADQLYSDLGMTTSDAGALFDTAIQKEENWKIVQMTEPYLLACLRRRLFEQGFSITFADLINYYLSLKPRGFVILSGISGTGKSQLPRLFAGAILQRSDPPLANFQPVPVRPGWNDVADLMGYYNSIHGGFEPGPALEAFKKASDAKDTHGTTPVFLLLDELNLSRVEHYFADFLSVMESRHENDGVWITDPLRIAAGRTGTLNFVGQSANAQPFVDSVDADLPIPENLFVVGTVNIDESTQGISNKVLDRANTIELENVDFSPPEPPEPDDYQHADLHVLAHHLVDRRYRAYEQAVAAHQAELATVTQHLTELNEVLKGWRLHFGIRIRNEVCTYMAYAYDFCEQAKAIQLDLEGFDDSTAFDRQVLQKILPRISGTREELQLGPRGNLFEQLTALLNAWGAQESVSKLDNMKVQEFANFWEA
ncbi:McrB family protein [Ferrimicrobium acidiphilum]|uniref:McrB family protein n=2 Tax=Ferrimicrobium TaxID=121038 RepID=A0ABV3Y4M5_9ACTN